MSSARDVTVSKSVLPDGASTAARQDLAEALLTLIEGSLNIDGVTNALRTIDYHHHEIHSGSTYRVGHFTTSGTQLIIAFFIPDQAKEIHHTFDFVAELKAHVTLYEAPTWTTNTGTRRSVKQSNRTIANNSIIEGDGTGGGGFTAGEVVIDPTGLAGGTAIATMYVFSPKQTGNEGGHDTEIILKPNTMYAIVMDSDDGAKGMQLRTEWYEHAPI